MAYTSCGILSIKISAIKKLQSQSAINQGAGWLDIA